MKTLTRENIHPITIQLSELLEHCSSSTSSDENGRLAREKKPQRAILII